MVRKRNWNKRASLADVIMIGVILLVFSMGTLIAFYISNEINTKIAESGALDSLAGAPKARNAMNQVNNMYPNIVDNSFLFLTIGLAIVAIILAMLVAVHPIFFVFYIVMLLVVIFISGVFSNIYQEMAAVSTLTDVASQLVFTSYVMTYLPFIVGVIGFIIAIVMYKTFQASGQ